MEAKYVQAIKAGIIGGVILAACMLVNLFIEIITTNSYALTGLGLVGCCVFLIEIIVLLGTGALAVKMAASLIAQINDALIVGGIAGAIAGLIGTIIQVLGAVIRPSLTASQYMEYYNYYGYDYGTISPALSMFTGAVGAVCCCGPALIVVGAILAAIGGAIYAVAVLKIK